MDEKKLKIMNAIISAEVTKGHMAWKVSDIARAQKVSRSLLYFYFGRSKKAILKECLELVAQEYFGLSEKRRQFFRENGWEDSLESTRQMFLKNPHLATFYMKWRTQPSEIQKILISIENRYRENLSKVFPHLDTEQLVALHVVLHGLITAPFITPTEFKQTVRRIESLWSIPSSSRK